MDTIEMTATYQTTRGEVSITLTDNGDFDLTVRDELTELTIPIPAEAIDRLRADQAARNARQSLRSDTTQ